MSKYSGKQGKGAGRARKEQKRLEARERQEQFNDCVAKYAQEHGVEPTEARKVLAKGKQ